MHVGGQLPGQVAERDARTSLQQAREQERAAAQAVGTEDGGQATVRAREAALAIARHALASATVYAPRLMPLKVK